MQLLRRFRRCFIAPLLLALAACGSKPQPTEKPPVSVRVITVQPQDVPLTREFVGRLAATRSADVRARVAGVLQRRVYKEGTEVKAGQLLFQIDPTPLQAELNGKLAALARADAEATNAKVIAERARKLITQRLISQADLDTAEANERSTSAQRKQAQADVESARIRVGYTSVTAPIAGRAGEQRVTEGALVGQDGATLLTIIEQIDPIYVGFDLPANGLEHFFRAQSTGQVTAAAANQANVQIVLPDGSVYAETGKVDFTGTSVDPSTGTVAFRGLLPNPNRHLMPGLFVKVRLSLGQRNQAFVLPQSAVLRDVAGAYVWTVAADNRAIQKHITTESMQGTDWIASGLAAGDRVIVDGVMSVRPDAIVNPSPADAQQPQGADRPE